MEHWGYLIQRPYIQFELTKKDMDSIISRKYGEGKFIMPVDLQTSLKSVTQNKKTTIQKWFIRLSTRSMKDAFYGMKPVPLTNHVEIVERLCDSKRVYDDIKLSRKYDTSMFLFMTEWDDNMNIRHEFRCFVRNGQLIGISQYDLYLDLNYMECELRQLTYNIKNFIDSLQYDELNYVADVLVDDKTHCSLIEINPYDVTTSAIHYTWGELELRYICKRLTFKYRLFDNIKEYDIKITEY
jgi:hypothetical protein